MPVNAFAGNVSVQLLFIFLNLSLICLDRGYLAVSVRSACSRPRKASVWLSSRVLEWRTLNFVKELSHLGLALAHASDSQ